MYVCMYANTYLRKTHFGKSTQPVIEVVRVFEVETLSLHTDRQTNGHTKWDTKAFHLTVCLPYNRVSPTTEWHRNKALGSQNLEQTLMPTLIRIPTILSLLSYAQCSLIRMLSW